MTIAAPALGGRLLYLPLDLTGAAASNAVTYEFHAAQTGQNAIVKPDYGPFYKASLSVYAQDLNNTLTLLTSGTDYVCAEYRPDLSAQAGAPVYQAVLLINHNLPGIYAVNYQAVGGETNVDIAHLTTLAANPTADVTIDFDDLQEKPPTFTPVAHQHDVSDFYGAEYLYNFLTRLNTNLTYKLTSYGTLGVSSVNAEIAAHVNTFRTTLKTDGQQLTSAISQHLATVGYYHTYTKAMVGLGNVQDGGFSAVTVNGVALPVYASPASVGSAIANRPTTADTNTHALITGANPHSDTPQAVGLGNVANLGMAKTYTTGQYATLLASGATSQYLTPWSATQSVIDAQSVQVTNRWTTPVLAITTASTGTLAQVSAKTQQAVDTLNAATAATSNATTAIGVANTKTASVTALNMHFTLVTANSPYCTLLNSILTYDYVNFATGDAVSSDGYYPIPSLIDNLYLWLDVGYSRNTYQTDSSANVRLMSLVDRSSAARQFVANTLGTAPTYVDSQDITQGVVGVSVGKVALFGPGIHMDQISGDPICIKPGYTVIALVRPLAASTPLDLLNDASASPTTSIVIQPVAGQAVSLSAALTTPWTPFVSADNTLDASTSTIVVASVSDTAEQYNWLATVKPRPAGSPRGTNTPASTWPASTVQSPPMTRLGNADSGALSGGELIELIIYNRQLSFAEVQSVINYLRLAKSHNNAFTVDTTAQNAF